MRPIRTVRVRPGIVLVAALLSASSGCIHNHYYGATPVASCDPSSSPLGPSSTSVPFGQVCEIPSQVTGGSGSSGGTVVATSPVPPGPLLSGPRPPRVVLSEPNTGPRFAWRRADPDSGLATTRVEGNIDDPSVTR
jgi:hypothetical protein